MNDQEDDFSFARLCGEEDASRNAQSCAPADNLSRRVSSLEAGLRAVAASNVQLVDQMQELALAVKLQQEASVAHDKLMTEIRLGLQRNTELTSDALRTMKSVHDVIVTGRVMGRVFKWGAPTLAAVVTWLATRSETFSKVTHILFPEFFK